MPAKGTVLSFFCSDFRITSKGRGAGTTHQVWNELRAQVRVERRKEKMSAWNLEPTPATWGPSCERCRSSSSMNCPTAACGGAERAVTQTLLRTASTGARTKHPRLPKSVLRPDNTLLTTFSCLRPSPGSQLQEPNAISGISCPWTMFLGCTDPKATSTPVGSGRSRAKSTSWHPADKAQCLSKSGPHDGSCNICGKLARSALPQSMADQVNLKLWSMWPDTILGPLMPLGKPLASNKLLNLGFSCH